MTSVEDLSKGLKLRLRLTDSDERLSMYEEHVGEMVNI